MVARAASICPAGPGTREEVVDGELAEHPFGRPPATTKAAAKAFRHGLLLGDRAWRLGAEAFFREQAKAVGFAPMAPSAYRAGHVDTFLPGVLAHAAGGTVGGRAAFLVLTDAEDYEDMGWSNLVVELDAAALGQALLGGLPPGDGAKRGSIKATTDGRSLIVSGLDGGARDRSAAEFEAFFAAASRLAAGLTP